MRGRFGLVQSLGVLFGVVVFVAAGSPVDAAKAKKEKAARASKAKPIEKASYGTVDGKPVDLYTLTNAQGRGRQDHQLRRDRHRAARARQGRASWATSCSASTSVDDYVAKSPYFGAIVGRVANRIANAKFTLDGKTYKLNTNNAPHHLHGGKKGWDKVIWTAEPKETQGRPVAEADARVARRRGELPGHGHGDGDLHADQRQRAEGRDEATTDKTTLINMAHHSYWNLAGGGTILDQELTIPADSVHARHPDGSGRRRQAGEGHAFRLHERQADRQGPEGGGRQAGRLRPQLDRQRRPARDAPDGEAEGSEVGARADR